MSPGFQICQQLSFKEEIAHFVDFKMNKSLLKLGAWHPTEQRVAGVMMMMVMNVMMVMTPC